MVELVQANWVAFVIVAALAIFVALWLVARPRKERVRSHRPDVLDEGVEPAKRNQALIDSAPAASSVVHEHEPPITPEGLAGMGEVVGAAALIHDERLHKAELPEAPDQLPADADDAQAVAAAIKIDAADHPGGDGDDLSRIKGVGPKIVAMLGDMGISRYDQIAAWSDEDVQRIDAQLGRFAGRITRDDWRTQAKFLAEGNASGYESKFGKL